MLRLTWKAAPHTANGAYVYRKTNGSFYTKHCPRLLGASDEPNLFTNATTYYPEDEGGLRWDDPDVGCVDTEE